MKFASFLALFLITSVCAHEEAQYYGSSAMQPISRNAGGAPQPGEPGAAPLAGEPGAAPRPGEPGAGEGPLDLDGRFQNEGLEQDPPEGGQRPRPVPGGDRPPEGEERLRPFPGGDRPPFRPRPPFPPRCRFCPFPPRCRCRFRWQCVYVPRTCFTCAYYYCRRPGRFSE